MKLTDEGDLNNFLGVNIDRREYGKIKMTQPNLEGQILHNLWLFDKKVKGVTTPALTKIYRHAASGDFDI